MMLTRAACTVALAAGLGLPAAIEAQRGAERQPAMSDSAFWDFFLTKSEPSGTFPSENFVSNEMGFQQVIPTLQRTLTPDGVYLGVGPEQNFTYIANLKPRMAVIFDIRRQNAMQHLMYKTMFELSPTRAEFAARLFSRPRVARLAGNTPVKTLFDSALAAPPSDSAYQANRVALFHQLKTKHGFAISPDDSVTIERVYGAFYRAGPDINYGYRSSSGMFFQSVYPSFAMLQSATNADSVPMAFLATEEQYRVVRDLQVRNLIVPVVGDFSGPLAIRSVAEYLKKQKLKVTAFYLSNVEQYLFRNQGGAERFYLNVSALPIDSTSTLIRSVPPGGFGGMPTFFASPGMGGGFGGSSSASGNIMVGGMSGSISISMVDSGGVRVTRITQDSAGVPITRVLRDTSGAIGPFVIQRSPPVPATAASPQDSATLRQLKELSAKRDSLLQQLRTNGPGGLGAMLGGPIVSSPGLLSSGIATIHDTLDRFFGGRLTSYQQAIEMTKTSGWR